MKKRIQEIHVVPIPNSSFTVSCCRLPAYMSALQY